MHQRRPGARPARPGPSRRRSGIGRAPAARFQARTKRWQRSVHPLTAPRGTRCSHPSSPSSLRRPLPSVRACCSPAASEPRRPACCPGAAQDTVSTWLKTVGISVPAGERAEEDGDLPDSGQSPGEETGENADLTPVDEGRPPAADHGERVSDTAKNTTAEGADKGEEISGVASDGRVESGHRDLAGDDNGEPPLSAPNSGGTDTASDATDGQGARIRRWR